jgi:uncharacterized protein (TIGR02453 family)
MKKTYSFLNQLNENNNREWFHANKAIYNEAKKEFEEYIDLLIPKIKEIDNELDVTSAKDCTFRIFRDVRFSKNKLPYKVNFGAHVAKGGRKSKYAGFYVHIEPNNSFIGGGVYMPQSNVLKAIRTEIFENSEGFKQVIENGDFKKYFPKIYGDKLKTAPRGFPKDFEDIDLIRYKGYAVMHKVEDKKLISDSEHNYLLTVFNELYNLNKYLNKTIANTE